MVFYGFLMPGAHPRSFLLVFCWFSYAGRSSVSPEPSKESQSHQGSPEGQPEDFQMHRGKEMDKKARRDESLDPQKWEALSTHAAFTLSHLAI